MPKGASPGILVSLLRRVSCALAGVALAASPLGAAAEAFYKWVDQDGKTQYAGQPPKNFTGEVIRIEVDPRDTPAPAAKPRAVPHAPGKTPPPADAAAKRRDLRGKLQADLDRARAKLELAKEQLAEGAAPQDDERQVIQHRSDKGSPFPGSGAMHGAATRTNCRAVTGAEGKSTLICATVVPNEAYRERQEKLEEAVRVAEEEVAAAEQAYRRGVD